MQNNNDCHFTNVHTAFFFFPQLNKNKQDYIMLTDAVF